MPKFSFRCPNCENVFQKFVRKQVLEYECEHCNLIAVRQLPNLSNPKVTEVVDKLTGVTHREDHKKLIRDRNSDYYWKHEVPRLVAKYSLETCFEQGWLYLDDDGRIQTHTKPPHKR